MLDVSTVIVSFDAAFIVLDKDGDENRFGAA